MHIKEQLNGSHFSNRFIVDGNLLKANKILVELGWEFDEKFIKIYLSVSFFM